MGISLCQAFITNALVYRYQLSGESIIMPKRRNKGKNIEKRKKQNKLTNQISPRISDKQIEESIKKLSVQYSASLDKFVESNSMSGRGVFTPGYNILGTLIKDTYVKSAALENELIKQNLFSEALCLLKIKSLILNGRFNLSGNHVDLAASAFNFAMIALKIRIDSLHFQEDVLFQEEVFAAFRSLIDYNKSNQSSLGGSESELMRFMWQVSNSCGNTIVNLKMKYISLSALRTTDGLPFLQTLKSSPRDDLKYVYDAFVKSCKALKISNK